MFWTAAAPLAACRAWASPAWARWPTLALAEGYRLNRIEAFLDAESDPAGTGFQTLQALIAMGNGGLTGLGLGASRSKFFYIPESHTDGVFAIIGEELGLIAALAIVAIFMLFMVRGYQVANRARDDFGALLAVGITTWIVAQALMNIGGITRVIPLAGIPLPYLSFGNNALAAVMLATGVLISVSRYARSQRSSAADDAKPKKAIVRRVRE
ncbi:MAG: FtsW/RodA/SpoVE family cell cycle protein [Dehalococcoidia bacterium]|nr:FtsW/RodA/SpoVE family cell cycle protein [Dehalococcoidia bacterium]